MIAILLVLVLLAVVSCGRALLQIRDEIRFGVVCENLDDFLDLLNRTNLKTVFRKSLSNYGSGRYAYSLLADDALFTIVSFENIDDKFPKDTRIIERKHKLG